jgi:GNAT superfamily N-acetyltransferase
MTHAMGIGMEAVSREEFDRLEEYFRSRGSACLIDLCPMADESVISEVMSRGYQIIEFNNLMLRRLTDADILSGADGVTVVGEDRREQWCRVVMQGFSGLQEVSEEEVATMMALPTMGTILLAELNGSTVGGAAMGLQQGIALLYGDATLVAARGQGTQQALIRRRLSMAREAGCEWAMATVIPGSGSHRNYERCGFELFYMRVNVKREWA